MLASVIICRTARCRLFPRRSSRMLSSRAASDATPSGSSDLESREKISFQEFLLQTEEAGPLWYRLSDSILTAYGAICFVTSVVDPAICLRYHFNDLEDFINVSFFVKFLLLYWSNNFSSEWLFTGKAALDLVSCLPVLGIPTRFMGGPTMERAIDVLQIARFLRLLREALPSRSGSDASGRPTITLEQQIAAVLLSLVGTVAVSATVLFLYENPEDQNLHEYRPFEDCLLYMVSVFAGRDPPWSPVEPLGKLVSAAATCLTIVFIPFLVSRALQLFSGGGTVQSFVRTSFSQTLGIERAQAPSDFVVEGPIYWAGLLQRLEVVAKLGLVSSQEAKELRRLCTAQDPQIQIVDLCYGKSCSDASVDMEAWKLYAERLQELLCRVAPEEPKKTALKRFFSLW